MKNSTTNAKQTGRLLALCTALTAMSGINTAHAEEIDSRVRSISYSQSTTLSTDSKQTLLEKTDIQTMQPLSKQGYRSESTNQSLTISTYTYPGDFSIYDASAELISDFDYDGFYHRISVSVDADTVYSSAYVYAELYISYEGGPWNYYASSDNFMIYGNSASDTFTVETELVEGFPTGHYDIRIDLYDAYHNEYLTSYGPYEDADLSALPLEDSYNDEYYDAVTVSYATDIYVTGGGAMNWWGLLLLSSVILLVRKFYRQ